MTRDLTQMTREPTLMTWDLTQMIQEPTLMTLTSSDIEAQFFSKKLPKTEL